MPDPTPDPIADPTPDPVIADPAPTPPTPADPAAAIAAARARAEAAEAKIKAAADAKTADDHAAQLAELTARAEAAEAQLAESQTKNGVQHAALKKTATLAALPGLKDSATFWPVIKDNVALTDAGELTDDAVAWLADFREKKAYLFDADAPGGTTALGGAATRKPGGYDAEQLRMFKEARTSPGAYKETELFKHYDGMFDHLGIN